MGKYSFNKILSERKNVTGCFIQYNAPVLVEILGYLGMDYVILDMEHGAMTFTEASSLITSAEAADLAALVRIPNIDETYIKKSLDIGACGLVVPNVKNREDAELLVKYAKFYPDGKRGNCPYVRANRYGIGDHEGYYKKSNDDITLYVLLESAEAVENAEDIISVPGIDAVGVGNVDLAVDMGLGRQSTHPSVMEKVKDVAAIAKKYGKHSDGFVIDEKDIELYRSFEGIDYYCVMSPSDYVVKEYRRILSMVKKD